MGWLEDEEVDGTIAIKTADHDYHHDENISGASSSLQVSTPDKVSSLYKGNSAKTYANMMEQEVRRPLYTDILSRLADRLRKFPANYPLVDTACGSGHMLWRYQTEFDPNRPVLGVDIEPAMIAIARTRLNGKNANAMLGDMCDLNGIIEEKCVAGLINYFSIHHLSSDRAANAIREWHRVLIPDGQLIIAIWEGSGAFDYGGQSDVTALRYTQEQLTTWVDAAGFTIDNCEIYQVLGMESHTMYLEATKTQI